jgi:hypothetical protein
MDGLPFLDITAIKTPFIYPNTNNSFSQVKNHPVKINTYDYSGLLAFG